MYASIRLVDTVQARVTKMRPDGMLDLSARKKAYAQMDEDAERVWQAILSYGGKLPLHDRSDPEEIKRELQMSKAAFKRAVGRLLREQKVRMTEEGVEKA